MFWKIGTKCADVLLAVLFGLSWTVLGKQLLSAPQCMCMSSGNHTDSLGKHLDTPG